MASQLQLVATEKTAATRGTFDNMYHQLNPEQRQAVDAIEGVVMVLAGPGTGKTQVVAMRIANILLKTQMDPQNILCLTFTESGVAAMRKRLVSIIGTVGYYVRIHTFHSFCNEVIQENPEKFSFARELEVLSDIERVEILRESIDELPATSVLKPYGNPHLYLPDIAHNIQSLKQEHVQPGQYQEIVDTIAQLVKKTAPLLEQFTNTDPVERNPEVLVTSVLKLEKQFAGLPTPFIQLQKIYARYQQGVVAAEAARATKSLVTKFKNDVTRWHTKLLTRLPKQREMKKVYERYQEKIRERGRYDFEDMIIFVVEKFKEDDELLARYQEQFQYILVDEYQDTNGAQNETVTLLGQFHDNPNIFAVGDDKQSIYRFQGASMENLLYLYQRYKEYAQVIVLQKNYRSQQHILDAAEGVIGHNQELIDRYIPNTTQHLVAARTIPLQPVAIHSFDSPQIESYFIAKKIKELLKEGVAPSQIAVLYRRNADAVDVADVLLKMDIPLQVERGDNILDDPLIQQLLHVLRSIAEPLRSDLLLALLHFEFLNLTPLDIVKVQSYSARERIELFAVLSSREKLQKAEVENSDALEAFAKKIAHWQIVVANVPFQEFLAHVVQESGLYDFILLADDHVEALNRITTLFTEAKILNRRNKHLTLPEFLAHIQLLEEHDVDLKSQRLQTQVSAVSLMTAHKAKGLEFEHVFITRAIDKHWGNLREHSLVPLPTGILKFDRVAGQENNEDERRLFYVALTRAKHAVYCTYATTSESGRAQVPSLFLEELPAQFKEVHAETEVESDALSRLQLLTVRAVVPQSDHRLEGYLKSMLTRYTLSVTHLNSYLECPRLFYYRHLLRAPYVPTKHMALGTAVHAALYEFHLAVTAKKIPSQQFLLKSFSKNIAKEILSDTDLKDTSEVGSAMLTEYYAQYHQSICRHSLLEYNFKSHGVTLDGIPLTGKIDKIEIIDPDKKIVHVVDYKTSNPDKKRAELKPGGAYHRQLVFYKLLCDNSPQFPYSVAAGEIDFLQKSAKLQKFVKPRIKVTDADSTELKKTIKNVWQEINKLAFLKKPEDEFCGKCEYCLVVRKGRSHWNRF